MDRAGEQDEKLKKELDGDDGNKQFLQLTQLTPCSSYIELIISENSFSSIQPVINIILRIQLKERIENKCIFVHCIL